MVFKSKVDEGNHTKYKGLSGKTGKGVRINKPDRKILININRVRKIIDERQIKKVKETTGVLRVLKKGLEKKVKIEVEILAEECRRCVRFLMNLRKNRH